MALIFKFFFIMVVYQIYTKVENPLFPALTWTILYFLLHVIVASLSINLLLMSSINFVIAYGTFFLAKYFDDSMWGLPVLSIGLGLLLFL